jgi:hypothetical protein
MRPQTTGVQAAGVGLDPACSAISAGIRHPTGWTVGTADPPHHPQPSKLPSRSQITKYA